MPARSAARARTAAAPRSSARVWDAITASRSRAAPSGAAAGATASQNTPCSSAYSTIRAAGSASPTSSGTMCVLRAGDLEALARELVAQRLGVVEQLLDAARLLLEQLERRHRGGDGDRRRGGRVQQRACAVDEVAGGHVVAAREAAVGAERLAERAGDDVDLVLEPGLGHGAAAARADRADRLRLVDQHADVVAVRELDDLLERRDVAVEPEHAVGRDQRAAAVGLLEAPREVLGVAVPVGERVGARQPAAVDDRGVRRARRGRRPRPCAPAPGSRRGWRASPSRTRTAASAPVKRGEPLLEPAVQRHRPGRHRAPRPRRRPSASPRRPPPRARAGDRRARGCSPSTARAPAARRAPPAGPVGRSPCGAAVEAELLELVQAVVEIQHPRSLLSRAVSRTVRPPSDGSSRRRGRCAWPCTSCRWRPSGHR